MHCPFCHNPDSRVVDTRIADDGASIRRRRECTHCKKRFTTLETSSFQVVKRSGVVESFSRNKVVSGVKKACQGRPVSDDQLAILAQQVEEQLRSTGVSNVSTEEVGKAILPFLRDLDVIAYLRFASVYRQFDTLDDFEQAIQVLRERAQGGDTASEAGAHADVEPEAPAPAKKPRKVRSARKRPVSNAPTLLGDD